MLIDGREVPNPGSDEALALGCICPVLDNAHGRGAYGGYIYDAVGQPFFWTNAHCPLHGLPENLAPPPPSDYT